MLIQVFRNSYEQGLLKNERDGSSILAPFIGGANVAFRREAIHQAGIYDPLCLTMEDADICIRISKLNWEIYRDPSAKVSHKNPTSLKSLIKQWKGYMYHMPYLYKKHNQKAIEIFALDRKLGRIRCIFYQQFPVSVLLVANNTLKILLSLLLFTLSAVLKWQVFAYILLGISIFYILRYLFNLTRHFYINMKQLGYFKKEKFQDYITLLQFIGINCIENIIVIFFSFWGGLRNGMLFIYGDPSH